MKTATSKDRKPVKASGKSALKIGSVGVKNSSKKTNKLNHKAKGD